MKLYVCWGTFPVPGKGHPCREALEALRAAGHEPEVVRSYGAAPFPDAVFNRTGGRREAKRLTGSSQVPVLVTDDGQAIAESSEIVAWAVANPARAAAAVA